MSDQEGGRRIAHFSCGAASAVATKLSNPDEIWYAATGSEDADNQRFLHDCESWFDQEVRVIRSDKYASTWDLWEQRRYLSGVAGAPCTTELKVFPRLQEQRAEDVHIFGYTADAHDIRRAKALIENWPEQRVEIPLIERGINKAACLALIQQAGIAPPRVYALGFLNANCIPCVKAQSPSYWALVRKHYPDDFKRMAKLSRELGVTLARMQGVRVFIDDIPLEHPVTEPIAPECDFLCALAQQDLGVMR
jgi:hypothetical protein